MSALIRTAARSRRSGRGQHGGLAGVRGVTGSFAGVAVVVVLRKHIGVALGRGLRRVKAGPVEVEFDQVQIQVQVDLARSPELADDLPVPAPIGSLSEVLSRLAETSPKMAVLTAYHRIEERLTEILESADALSRDWARAGGWPRWRGSVG